MQHSHLVQKLRNLSYSTLKLILVSSGRHEYSQNQNTVKVLSRSTENFHLFDGAELPGVSHPQRRPLIFGRGFNDTAHTHREPRCLSLIQFHMNGCHRVFLDAVSEFSHTQTNKVCCNSGSELWWQWKTHRI